MTKTLTVHNAEVRTATVEVNSLTISGKQVTLAVFRQLIEEDPIDWRTGQWIGLPWGFVNYLSDDKRNRHVVWQKGTELRRAVVEPIHPKDESPSYCDAADRYVSCAVRLGRMEYQERHRIKWSDGLVSVGYNHASRSYDYQDRNDHGRPAIKWNFDTTEAELEQAAAHAHSQAQLDHESWMASCKRWEEILALPQLFIAV